MPGSNDSTRKYYDSLITPDIEEAFSRTCHCCGEKYNLLTCTVCPRCFAWPKSPEVKAEQAAIAENGRLSDGKHRVENKAEFRHNPETCTDARHDVQAHEGENDDVPTENGLETGSSVRNNPDIAGDVRLGGSQEVGGPQEGREELL